MTLYTFDLDDEEVEELFSALDEAYRGLYLELKDMLEHPNEHEDYVIRNYKLGVQVVKGLMEKVADAAPDIVDIKSSGLGREPQRMTPEKVNQIFDSLRKIIDKKESSE